MESQDWYEAVEPDLEECLQRAEAEWAARQPAPVPPPAVRAPTEPWFFPSELGALLGHGYGTEDEAFLGVCSRASSTRMWVAEAKAKLGVGDADELREAAAQQFPELGAAAVKQAAAAAAAAPTVEAASAALAAAVTAASKAVAAFAGGDARVAADLKAAHIGAIHMARGVAHEPAVLDELAARTGAAVTQRGSDYTLRCRGFTLFGRIDGLSADTSTLVEAKSRRCPLARAGRQPRTTHLIQVRAYLRLLAPRVRRALLVERFGCGGVRETEIMDDDGLWYYLEGELGAVAERFRRITQPEVAELVARTCRRIRRRSEPSGAPHEHALAMTEDRLRAICDLCGKRPPRALFHTCIACDYDECDACFTSRAAAAAAGQEDHAPAAAAMGETQPVDGAGRREEAQQPSPAAAPPSAAEDAIGTAAEH